MKNVLIFSAALLVGGGVAFASQVSPTPQRTDPQTGRPCTPGDRTGTDRTGTTGGRHRVPRAQATPCPMPSTTPPATDWSNGAMPDNGMPPANSTAPDNMNRPQ